MIGEIFKTFKILKILKTGNKTGAGFFLGKCIICGFEKELSKVMIQKAEIPNRKRNLTCPSCLISARRGGGLKVGDQKDYLRIISTAGTKGKVRIQNFSGRLNAFLRGMVAKKL